MGKNPQSQATLPLHVNRMLTLLEYIGNERTHGCLNTADAARLIGYNPKNLYNVRSGAQEFMPKHYAAAVSKLGVDANYFFNRTHAAMFRKPAADPVDTIIQAALSLRNT